MTNSHTYSHTYSDSQRIRPVVIGLVHETLRITPARALGVTDHIWDIGELIEAATLGASP